MRDLNRKVNLPDGVHRFPNEYFFKYKEAKYLFCLSVKDKIITGGTGFGHISSFTKERTTKLKTNLYHFHELEEYSKRDIRKEINEHIESCPCPLNFFHVSLPKNLARKKFTKEVEELIVEHEIFKALKNPLKEGHDIYIDVINKVNTFSSLEKNYFTVILNCSCKKEKEK